MFLIYNMQFHTCGPICTELAMRQWSYARRTALTLLMANLNILSFQAGYSGKAAVTIAA